MSRTTRDLPDQCDEIERDEYHIRLDKGIIAVRRVTTRTLRYSANEQRRAEEEGRRAVPEYVVRKLEWFHYTWGSQSVSTRRQFLRGDRECAARTLMRDQFVNAKKSYNTKNRRDVRRGYSLPWKEFDVDIKPLSRWDIGWDLF